MCYRNTPTRFCTDPGEGNGTSRYYVFKNGTIRAKFATQDIHVRPGKNICYIPDESSARESSKPDSMKLDDAYVSYADVMAPKGKYQKPAIGKAPVDFHLDANGNYEGGFHHGHEICAEFSAKIGDKPVDLEKFDQYIIATYTDGDPDMLRDDAQDEVASLQGYQKWLGGHNA